MLNPEPAPPLQRLTSQPPRPFNVGPRTRPAPHLSKIIMYNLKIKFQNDEKYCSFHIDLFSTATNYLK